MIEVATAIVALIVPIAIGALAGRVGAFGDPDAAIDAMNRVALHVAFPALVIGSLSDPGSPIAHGPGFLAIVPVSLLVALVLVRLVARTERAGTIALVVAFGNTAYLGLPFVAAVLGSDALATASVAVAIHVALAMTVGPALLVRWGSDRGASAGIATLARQPIVWSPLIGLAVRALPAGIVEPLRAVLVPLGAMAAPLSMILLGLYLHVHRSQLRPDRDVLAHVGARLVVAPAVTIAIVIGGRELEAITRVEGRVLVILSAMPAAITTFAIALEHGIGAERVASAIVASTVAAAVTLPVVVAIALALP